MRLDNGDAAGGDAAGGGAAGGGPQSGSRLRAYGRLALLVTMEQALPVVALLEAAALCSQGCNPECLLLHPHV